MPNCLTRCRTPLAGLAAIPLLALACVSVQAADTNTGPTASSKAVVHNTNRPPMELGAASNFSQGWNLATFQSAVQLPMRRFRDGIRWSEVERERGRYDFETPRTAYMAQIGQAGAHLTLTLNWGNPLYDAGKTPHSAEALEAFGRFAAALIARFPTVDQLEIGNEFNGGNFVSGPVAKGGLEQRRRYHLAMVRSAARHAKAVRPQVKVLGGATHSLPAGYLWPLLEEDSPAVIEGLAVHPYTTAIDQLQRQIAVLRRSARAAHMPLYVTEFASRDPARAADDLVRAYATLSSAGVKEMDWYPLNERGDGHVPLLNRDQSLTVAGRAFRFVQNRLARHAAADISPDFFTMIHAFGPRTWVMWGASRPVMADGSIVRAFDATGSPLPVDRLQMAADRAIVLVGSKPLVLGTNVRIGCNPLIADSFYQFTYPASTDTADLQEEDGFERFIKLGQDRFALETMPGQQRRGVPWTPYLGRQDLPGLRLTADTIAWAGRTRRESRRDAPYDGATEIVHRYRVREAGHLMIRASFTPAQESGPEFRVSMDHNDRQLTHRSGRSQITIERAIRVDRGDSLSVALAVPAGVKTGPVAYRIRLLDPDKCPSAAVALSN
ncbi:hypothetical protein SAMN06295987_102580 [Novosphingobium mathurense]|uniref:Glycosyl hydrolase catalytic core n=2 Tax=Novosphingobium mathurense TaxID=428990 RepID=A0A1U6HJS2_9SPHN|nr:hypothetical protein SAMN06295987_102580 [Novosphingobium mathurense]